MTDGELIQDWLDRHRPTKCPTACLLPIQGGLTGTAIADQPSKQSQIQAKKNRDRSKRLLSLTRHAKFLEANRALIERYRANPSLETVRQIVNEQCREIWNVKETLRTAGILDDNTRAKHR